MSNRCAEIFASSLIARQPLESSSNWVITSARPFTPAVGSTNKPVLPWLITSLGPDRNCLKGTACDACCPVYRQRSRVARQRRLRGEQTRCPSRMTLAPAQVYWPRYPLSVTAVLIFTPVFSVVLASDRIKVSQSLGRPGNAWAARTNDFFNWSPRQPSRRTRNVCARCPY